MSKLVLIESLNAAEGNVLTESVNGGKDMYLSGVFMQAEQKIEMVESIH